ncbi:MAG: DegV family protein [Lachnospiraceae bacterium]|nr:DegV family protein [Lachnospiraceae bacterium]
MNNFVLTCCSTADMAKEYFQRREIPYVCFHFHMGGKDYVDDLGETIPFDKFYKLIADGATPTTSQVNSDEFETFFEPYLKEGKDILHICLSSGLSGVFNSANIAKKELLAKYPERKIEIVDSLGASSGYGMLVDYIADLRDKGASLKEAYAWAEEHKLNVHHWFFSTDLTSYKRGGRITSTAAMVGTILGVCPLLNMNNLGQLIPRKKIRTKRRVIEEIVKMMELHIQDGKDYPGKCFMSHSACYEDASRVKGLIEGKFPQLKDKVIINSVGTTIGSHTGPGTVALFFMGDLRID